MGTNYISWLHVLEFFRVRRLDGWPGASVLDIEKKFGLLPFDARARVQRLALSGHLAKVDTPYASEHRALWCMTEYAEKNLALQGLVGYLDPRNPYLWKHKKKADHAGKFIPLTVDSEVP